MSRREAGMSRRALMIAILDLEHDIGELRKQLVIEREKNANLRMLLQRHRDETPLHRRECSPLQDEKG